LTLGDANNLKADEEGTRARAIKLFRAITEAACKAFSAEIEEADSGKCEVNQEMLKGMAMLVDQSAQQLYFASGTFHDPQVQQPLSAAQRKRFYEAQADTNRSTKQIWVCSNCPPFD
jgi:predicted component of type VI protein secretion system